MLNSGALAKILPDFARCFAYQVWAGRGGRKIAARVLVAAEVVFMSAARSAVGRAIDVDSADGANATDGEIESNSGDIRLVGAIQSDLPTKRVEYIDAFEGLIWAKILSGFEFDICGDDFAGQVAQLVEFGGRPGGSRKAKRRGAETSVRRAQESIAAQWPPSRSPGLSIEAKVAFTAAFM